MQFLQSTLYHAKYVSLFKKTVVITVVKVEKNLNFLTFAAFTTETKHTKKLCKVYLRLVTQVKFVKQAFAP